MIDRKRLEIKSRLSFYRNQYRRGIKQLIFFLSLIIILIVAIFYRVLNEPERAFYASTNTGEIVQLKPLEAPNNSSTPLIDVN